MPIYKGQDFRVRLTTEEDLTGYSSVKIRYKKPEDTVIYEVTGDVENATQGIIYGDITNAINDTVGTWVFWGRVAVGAKILKSDPIFFLVKEEGEL